eukprot:GHVH01001916.1.p1 GENE.GHVH01001916.1~~GHVH01001916.1.p1  ORF type:complete len:632 (+),score=69.31 GHVH01001916.1:153-1898(+)
MTGQASKAAPVHFVAYSYPPAFQLLENDPIDNVISNLRTWVEECPSALQVTRESPEHKVWTSYWSKRLHDPYEQHQVQYQQTVLFAISKRMQRQEVSDDCYCDEVIGLTKWFLGDVTCDTHLAGLPECPQVKSSSDSKAMEGGICLRWAPDGNRQNPLFYQAASRGRVKIVRYYVEELKIPVNQEDTAMQTPIFYAARDGNIAVINYFLTETEANVNHLDSYKQSALFYAAKNLRKDAIQIMIETGGADVLVRDVQKRTAANWTDDQSIKTLLLRTQRAQQLEGKASCPQKRSSPNTTKPSVSSAKRRRFALTLSCPDHIRWDQSHSIPIIYDPDSLEQRYPTTEQLQEAVQSKSGGASFGLIPHRTTQTIPLIPMMSELQHLEQMLPAVSIWRRDWPSWGALPDEVTEWITLKECEVGTAEKEESLKKPDVKVLQHLSITMTPFRVHWINEFKKILQILMHADSNNWFSRPVDPIEDQCTDYNTVITKPMDFGTAKKKLNDGRYRFISEVVEDIELVFLNCFEYNRLSTNPVNVKGKELENDWKALTHTRFISVWAMAEKMIIRFILEHRGSEDLADMFK